MELFANELSVHEQFHFFEEFHNALAELMKIRNAANQYQREVYFSSNFVDSKPFKDMTIRQAINQIRSINDRRAVMRWLTKSGPFWNESRKHHPDDWMEFNGDIVTDSGVGEAAFRKINGTPSGVISLTPSNWEISPLVVSWRVDDSDVNEQTVELPNCWNIASFEKLGPDIKRQVNSWNDLNSWCLNHVEMLVFAENWLEPLKGVPFNRGAVDGFVTLIHILANIAKETDHSGQRTEEGDKIYQDYFVGSRARFSDSSATEKRNFQKELTFNHPEESERPLFCPWHGKVSRMTLRLHFSWPKPKFSTFLLKSPDLADFGCVSG